MMLDDSQPGTSGSRSWWAAPWRVGSFWHLFGCNWICTILEIHWEVHVICLYIYIYIICWYVYDIFSRQKSIEKLVIELINLSFSTYPFIYWRRACCLNHSFKSQYVLDNLGLFYTKHLILPGSTRPSVTHGTRASVLYLKRKAGGDPPKIGWIRGMEKPTGPWDAKDDIYRYKMI